MALSIKLDDEVAAPTALLRLGSDGAAAIEAGGDTVRLPAGAPGKSSEGLHRLAPIFSTLRLAHALRALMAEGQAQLWHWQLPYSCLLWPVLQA